MKTANLITVFPRVLAQVFQLFDLNWFRLGKIRTVGNALIRKRQLRVRNNERTAIEVDELSRQWLTEDGSARAVIQADVHNNVHRRGCMFKAYRFLEEDGRMKIQTGLTTVIKTIQECVEPHTLTQCVANSR